MNKKVYLLVKIKDNTQKITIKKNKQKICELLLLYSNTLPSQHVLSKL